ncbi:MAG: hypothetical protein ACRCTI_10335, partial [Beijerinckiaceae bacterium]
MRCNTFLFVAGVLHLAAPDAAAQPAGKPVSELGGYGVLYMPAGKPRGSIILMAGGDGSLGITSDGQITRLQ